MEVMVVGYTGVHYAVKDSTSAVGFLLLAVFWITVGLIFVVIAIPVLLIWGTVMLGQYLSRRGQARRFELAGGSTSTQVGPGTVGYRYGPDVVDAIQWTGVRAGAGNNLAAVKTFLGVQFCGVLGPRQNAVIAFTGTTTSTSVGIAELGKWIVRSDEGLAAMADAEFRATYEYFSDESIGVPNSSNE